MFCIGGIVISKRGRDKGKSFVIVALEDAYVWLVDGQLRRIAKPKKKKTMHVQITNTVSGEIQAEVLRGGCLLDADFRKVLSRFQRHEEV
ncbi:MAG: KOW domain-containing RNA-binding protein [Clostridiales bacterium]|jgi:ribosomal protein L14E/L6E/L27E|nr:KOW domain-containing RNA-binding protein [Clostridiales bacterium]